MGRQGSQVCEPCLPFSRLPFVSPSHGLGRLERIRRRADFQLVYDRGVRVHGRLMTAIVLATDRHAARLGVAATRKLGGSVVRNRAKRLIREVFRRNKPGETIDLVLVPRKELTTAPFPDLEDDYRRLLARAGRMARRR
jgi:ribonuclease P protein component